MSIILIHLYAPARHSCMVSVTFVTTDYLLIPGQKHYIHLMIYRHVKTIMYYHIEKTRWYDASRFFRYVDRHQRVVHCYDIVLWFTSSRKWYR